MMNVTQRKSAAARLVTVAVGAALGAATARDAVAQPAGAVRVGAAPVRSAPAWSKDGAIAGRVLTPDGTPVAAARVSWVGAGTNDFFRPRVLASVQSDAAGLFLFDKVADFAGGRTPQLLVEAKGWGLTIPALPADDQAMEIRLRPATELQLRFVDEAGKPVEGARITAFALMEKATPRTAPSGSFAPREMLASGLPRIVPLPAAEGRFTVRTGADGTCRFSELPQGAQLRLQVHDERFAQLKFEESVVDLGASTTTSAAPIRLMAGATLRGRITFGPDGKPAAGVRVGAQEVRHSDWGEAVSDSDGRYAITGLRPGAYNVALDLKNKMETDWTAPAHEELSVAKGARLNSIDFKLVKGALVRGKVLAETSGKPVEGVHIGIYGPAHPRSGAWVQGVITGPDGAYQLRVPQGKQHLYIMMSAPPSGFSFPRSKQHDFSIADGQTRTIDFKLPPGAEIKPVQVVVLGPDNKPVADAEVEIAPMSEMGGMEYVGRTDADGKVTASQSAAASVTLRARRGDMATTKAVMADGSKTATLRLEKNALVTLAGRVTDVNGKPIAGAKVQLIKWTYDRGLGQAAATTDEAGRYTIAALWPDVSYSLSATAKGYGEAQLQQMQLQPGEKRDLKTLALKKADSFVAGRVVDEQGEPVPGAQVGSDGRDTPYQGATSDAAGTFRFDNVVAGKLNLWAVKGQRRAEKEAQSGDDKVVLVIRNPQQQETQADDGPQEQFKALLDKPAPALNAVAWVNSKPLTMQALRGKIVLIDFWGIGCGPCVAALPEVQRVSEQFADKGVVVIGLHDSGTTQRQLAQFAAARELSYPLAIDAEDKQRLSFGQTFSQYTVRGIPTYAVIARDGSVAFLDHSLAGAIAALSELLARSPDAGGGKTGG